MGVRKKAYKKNGKKQTKPKSRIDPVLYALDLMMGVLHRIEAKLDRTDLTRKALLDLYNAVRETAKEATGQYPEPAPGTAMWQAQGILETGKFPIHITVDDESVAQLREENTGGV